MTGAADLVAALGPVLALLDALAIEYVVGGSVASSAYGVPRATMDVDLVAHVEADHVDALALGLGDDYYASTTMIRDAIRSCSSFNLIHRPTMMKIDVFVAPKREFDRALHARRRRTVLAMEPTLLEAWVASAEDIVLSKLEWARAGDSVSELQLRDVVGVLRVQRGSLDEAYLLRWARVLGVVDLLERAMREAGEGI